MILAKAILFGVIAACLCISVQAGGRGDRRRSSGSSASKQSETSTVTTETTKVETIETTVTKSWQEYFVQGFSNWRSIELKSIELKDKVSTCFSQVVDGYTYWEKVSKNQQYLEFLAASTGYSGRATDSAALKSYCVQIAASKPRLLALAFKSISRNMKNSQEKLVVSKLAKRKYNIGEKVIEVRQDWKQYAIKNFINFKSADGRSRELITKVTSVLDYDSSYFDKFIQKKIYAEYLAYATGYSGDIKRVEELKRHLKLTARRKPRLVALGIKRLAINLKNPQQPLIISPLAVRKFGIREKTLNRIDWKTHFINEFYSYKSTGRYKEADQRLRVQSMLNYEANSGTILDLILKRQQYREFFARSIGYSYSESSYSEREFRDYIKTTSELYPNLVSLGFRSICKNLKNPSERLVISSTAQKFISEKLTTKTLTEKRTTQKITKTTTTTTVTKTWEEYAINEFSSLKSLNDDSDEVKGRVSKFLNYNAGGYTCLDKILKSESYSEYLAYSTGYRGNYKESRKLIEHLQTVGRTKPRLLASSLKYVTKNIQNSSEKLVVSKVATQNYNIRSRSFEAKLDWKKYVVKEFANFKSNEGKSIELGKRVLTAINYDESYWNKMLANTQYTEYLTVATGYTGSVTDVKAFQTHFTRVCRQKPRLAALSLKYLGRYFNKKDKLIVAPLAKTKYHIQEREISRVDWTSYAINNFATLKSIEDKSHYIKARLNKLIGINAGGSLTYLDKILKRTAYAEYIARSTGYTGDYRNEAALRKYVVSTIATKPRLIACSFKYIAKHQQNSESLLQISNVAKSRYHISDSSYSASSMSSSSSSTVTKRSSSSTIATKTSTYLQNFVNVVSESTESSKISSRITEFSQGSYLDEILRESSYAKYLATTLQYQGDYRSDAFKVYIKRNVLRERPLALALSLKRIYYNIHDNRDLVIPAFVASKYQVAATNEYALSPSYSGYASNHNSYSGARKTDREVSISRGSSSEEK